MRFADPNTPLDALVRQPWTVEITRDEENGFVARVRELPDAVVAADTAAELEKEFWPAIRASIAARLEFGLQVPLVAGFDPSVPHLPPLLRMTYDESVRIQTLRSAVTS